MRYTWDERKRRRNISDHGLDFIDCARVFDGPTFTFEDSRFDYDERRFVTLGILADFAVSIVHTESPSRIHIISFRKATKHEETILFQAIQD